MQCFLHKWHDRIPSTIIVLLTYNAAHLISVDLTLNEVLHNNSGSSILWHTFTYPYGKSLQWSKANWTVCQR